MDETYQARRQFSKVQAVRVCGSAPGVPFQRRFTLRIVLARLDVFEAEALRWEPASPFPASLVQWTGTMSKSVEL